MKIIRAPLVVFAGSHFAFACCCALMLSAGYMVTLQVNRFGSMQDEMTNDFKFPSPEHLMHAARLEPPMAKPATAIPAKVAQPSALP